VLRQAARVRDLNGRIKSENVGREMPRLTRTDIEQRLLAGNIELVVNDLELASFVCVTSIETLTHNAVLHYSKMLSDDAMEVFIDEGARLVTGYLKG
jgi:hypothetical protein